MDYLFYGFMWAFFWEYFTLQQGKPNDDIGRLRIRGALEPHISAIHGMSRPMQDPSQVFFYIY